MVPAELLGTIPGWITSASVVTLLTLLLRWQVLNRKLGLDGTAQKAAYDVDVLGRLLTRVTELEGRLTDEQRHCEERIKEVENRYDEELQELSNKYNGLIRLITQASVDRVVHLGADVPEDIQEMATRVGRILAQQHIGKATQ